MVQYHPIGSYRMILYHLQPYIYTISVRVTTDSIGIPILKHYFQYSFSVRYIYLSGIGIPIGLFDVGDILLHAVWETMFHDCSVNRKRASTRNGKIFHLHLMSINEMHP